MKKIISFITAIVLSVLPLYCGFAANEGSLELLTTFLSDDNILSGFETPEGTPTVSYSIKKDEGEWMLIIEGTLKEGKKGAIIYQYTDIEPVVLYVAAMCNNWDMITTEYGYSSFTMKDYSFQKKEGDTLTGDIIIDSKEKALEYVDTLKNERFPEYKELIEQGLLLTPSSSTVSSDTPSSQDSYSPLGLFLSYAEATINKQGIINELKKNNIPYIETTYFIMYDMVEVEGTNGDIVDFGYFEGKYAWVKYSTNEYEISAGPSSDNPNGWFYEYKDKQTDALIKFQSLDALLDKANISH